LTDFRFSHYVIYNLNKENTNSHLPTIEPWLQVSHGANAVQFYKTAFGATEAYRMDAPDGSVVAQLKISTAGFWISGGTDSNAEPRAEGAIRMIVTTPAIRLLKSMVGDWGDFATHMVTIGRSVFLSTNRKQHR
jgi:predicted enzyme related to lactoylglutathione lyase